MWDVGGRVTLGKEKALFSGYGSHSSIGPVVRPLSLGYLHRVVCGRRCQCGLLGDIGFVFFFLFFVSKFP